MNIWAKITSVLGLLSLGLIGVFCGGPERSLTIEELVEQHEASWAKLRHLRMECVDESSIFHGWKETRLNGDVLETPSGELNVHSAFVIHTGESRSRHQLFLDGSRTARRNLESEFRRIDEEIVGGTLRRTAEYVSTSEKPTRGFAEGDLRYSFGDSNVTISRRKQNHPAAIAIPFGVGISNGFVGSEKTLREWVAEARPRVRRTTNRVGETCYLLSGPIPTRVRFGTRHDFRTDELTLLINAERGCLIEQAFYKCADLGKDPASELSFNAKMISWRITKWRGLANRFSCPEAAYCELKARETDRLSWRRWKATSIELDPRIDPKLFDRTIPAGAIVYDETKRPGHSAVAIWGADGKAARTFESLEAYEAHLLREKTPGSDRGPNGNWNYTVANLFPSYVVKSMEESEPAIQISVYDERGELVREFRSAEEIYAAQFAQSLLNTTPQMLATEILWLCEEYFLPVWVADYYLGEEFRPPTAYFDDVPAPVIPAEATDEL